MSMLSKHKANIKKR